MSFFGNLFGRRPADKPTDAPAAFLTLAETLPAEGLGRCLLQRTATTVAETAAVLRQQLPNAQAIPVPESLEAAMGSAVVMATEEFVTPALQAGDGEAETTPNEPAGILFGMLVAFNLACQVKGDVPGLEPQDVMTAAFQTFSLSLETDEQARLAPIVLEGFQKAFQGDDGEVSRQVFEYVVLLIAHLLGDERISAGALKYEALAVLPAIRQLLG
jgi:hypothetical protein